MGQKTAPVGGVFCHIWGKMKNVILLLYFSTVM
jgi:hypothetical protein